MKKILMAAVALTAVTATPALAAAPSQTYNFSGNVDTLCTISGAATVGFGSLTGAGGEYIGNNQVRNAIDTYAYCNQGQTTAVISHTNLVGNKAATSGYTNIVPMSASLTTPEKGTFADSTNASGSTASAGTTVNIGAFTGLKVTATLGDIGADKLVAGDYSGSITVTLSPAS